MNDQHSLDQRIQQDREDHFMVLDLEGGPLRLDVLIEFAQKVFPSHELSQLAITQAEDDKFVLAAELNISTQAN